MRDSANVDEVDEETALIFCTWCGAEMPDKAFEQHRVAIHGFDAGAYVAPKKRCPICGSAPRDLASHLTSHIGVPITKRLLATPVRELRLRLKTLRTRLSAAETGLEKRALSCEINRVDSAIALRRTRATFVSGGAPGSGRRR